MIRRRRFHRLVFCVAGFYNIGWGLYAVYDPQWLFRFAGLPPMNYPQIFACLGMVVGLYGIIYFDLYDSWPAYIADFRPSERLSK